MVRITNNKDRVFRYVVSGSVQERSKFDNIVSRMTRKGHAPSVVFPFGNRLIATYRFNTNFDKEQFRHEYNIERESMRKGAKQHKNSLHRSIA